MITVVSGTPGAGKTYYTCRLIERAVRDGRYVATNVRLVDDWAERCFAGNAILKLRPGRRRRLIAEARRRLVYVQSMGELAALRLSSDGWERKLEGRGVAIFDEAGEEFDSREWNTDKDKRKADNRFLKQHRKYGWDVHLIAQELEQLDTRARGLAEYEVELRNLKRVSFPVLGLGNVKLFALFGDRFIARWRWTKSSQGAAAMKREWFGLDKRIASLYDTNQIVYEADEGNRAMLPAAHGPALSMLTAADLLAGGIDAPPSDVIALPSPAGRAPSEAAHGPLPVSADPSSAGHRTAALLAAATGRSALPRGRQADSVAPNARRAPEGSQEGAAASLSFPVSLPQPPTEHRSSPDAVQAGPSDPPESVPPAITPMTVPHNEQRPGWHPGAATTKPAVPGVNVSGAA